MNYKNENPDADDREEKNSGSSPKRRHLHHVPKSAAGHALIDLHPFPVNPGHSFGYIADDGFPKPLLAAIATLLLQALPANLSDSITRSTNPSGRVLVSVHRRDGKIKVELATTPFAPDSDPVSGLEKCVEQINFLLAHGLAPALHAEVTPHGLN